MTLRADPLRALVRGKVRLLRLRRLRLTRLHSTWLSAGKSERRRLGTERRILRAEGILHPTLNSLGSAGVLHLRTGDDAL